MVNWTEKRIERLKRLVAEGVSASAIAKKLGAAFTKGMVAGKIRRLGLTKKRTGRVAIKRIKTKPPAPVLAAVALKPIARPIEVSVPPRAAKAVQPAKPNGIRIWDLRDRHCRWPLGTECPSKFFCGAPALASSSWCLEHQRLAYPRAGAGSAGKQSNAKVRPDRVSVGRP